MKEKTVRELIKSVGVYITCVVIVLTIEFFIIRNGVSTVIGSQTAFWWLGIAIGIASAFAAIYFLFNLTMWLYHNIEKELNLED
jgi:uncharacterized membrane protein